MRRSLLLLLATALALSLPANADCDPVFVSLTAKVLTVQPTDFDDTANLQCAFDWAATIGPGVKVSLAEGTFFTEQLVVNGVRGTIRGMGQGRTIISNVGHLLPIDAPDCLTGTDPCFADSPPSATNRYPALISVLGDDVTLSDLSIEVVGTHITETWSMWGPFQIRALSETLQFYGSNSKLRIQSVSMAGEPLAPDAEGFWGGVGTCVLMWSFSRPWFVTGSSMLVKDSTFQGGAGVSAYNIDHSGMTLMNNRFELRDFGTATILSDVRNSRILVSHNEVVPLGPGVWGINMWPGNSGTGIESSWLMFDNNHYAGDAAMVIDPDTFHDDVKCLLVNNDVSEVTSPYVFNGQECRTTGP